MCITDDIITVMQQGQFGGRIHFIFAFFYHFPLFSETFTSIDEYAN